ncbi:MAG: ankyrin repeat domain-containing protein [Akkermansia sp.]|nr:ankyrin repeat domain-containing protein [Akkermansia sp.]
MKRTIIICGAMWLGASVAAVAMPDAWEWATESPFFAAAATNKPEAVEDLLWMLEQGADPNERLQGYTPLMVAAERANIPAMELLLYAGADVNAHTPEGETALSAAVRRNPLAVEYLLSRGAAIPEEGSPAHLELLEQTLRGKKRSLELLLQAGLAPDTRLEDGSTLLMSAVANERVEMVRLLLAAGADANATTPSGRTALRSAMLGRVVGKAEEARLEMMRLLLEVGVDPLRSVLGSNAFHAAAWGSRAQALFLLAEKCPQGLEVADDQGRTPLMIAAQAGDEETLRMLLALGGNASARDSKGNGVLAYAARSRHGSVARMQMLVEHGASLDADGDLALVAASQSGTPEAVRWLLQAGMDARDTVGNSGNTLLHVATHNEHGGVVEALLQGGAEVNAKNVVGHTPLHFAMTGLNPNRWHVISVLLREGADPYLCNNFDQNAIEWATPEIREKLLKLLKIEPKEPQKTDSAD